jgi:hypothetical protein
MYFKITQEQLERAKHRNTFDVLKNSNIQHKIIRAVNGKVLCELAEIGRAHV